MNAVDIRDAVDVREAKRQLRAQAKAARDALPAESRSHADKRIADAVCALPAWQQASELLCYLSFGSEVDTWELVRRAWEAGKLVFAPRCLPERVLAWHCINSFDQLVPSRFGVPEPRDGATWDPSGSAAETALALVPGLVFDRQGYRLGYGGGYYDRFMVGFPGTSVGLVRQVQLLPSLVELGVRESHDLPVQLLVSDANVWEAGSSLPR